MRRATALLVALTALATACGRAPRDVPTVTLRTSGTSTATADVLAAAADVMEDRLFLALPYSEVDVDGDRIVVRLDDETSGVDVVDVIDHIILPGRFTLRPVIEQRNPPCPASWTPQLVDGAEAVCFRLGPPELDDAAIASATPRSDEVGNGIDVKLTDEAAPAFDALARRLYGKAIAIVVDDVVLSAPTVNAQEFGGRLAVSGAFTAEEALALAAVLATEPLPVGLEIADTENLPAPATTTAAAASTGDGPTLNDHWHAAIGVYVCGKLLPPLQDGPASTHNIHAHGDGLIHIHPSASEYSGANATLGVFAEAVGMRVANDELAVPGSPPRRAGGPCGEEPGIVQLLVWHGPDDPSPKRIEGDPADYQLRDNDVITLAFAPEGAVIPQPPSARALGTPDDVPPGP